MTIKDTQRHDYLVGRPKTPRPTPLKGLLTMRGVKPYIPKGTFDN